MAMLLLSVPFQNPVTAAGLVVDVVVAAWVRAAPADPADIAIPSPAQVAIAARPAAGLLQSCLRLKNLVIAIAVLLGPAGADRRHLPKICGVANTPAAPVSQDPAFGGGYRLAAAARQWPQDAGPSRKQDCREDRTVEKTGPSRRQDRREKSLLSCRSEAVAFDALVKQAAGTRRGREGREKP
jgi:hypothetical protein